MSKLALYISVVVSAFGFTYCIGVPAGVGSFTCSLVCQHRAVLQDEACCSISLLVRAAQITVLPGLSEFFHHVSVLGIQRALSFCMFCEC
jgi:hypothetical protein